MDLTFFGDESRGLIRLDPRTKLLIFLASGLMSLNTFSDLGMFIFSLVICIVYALCGKPWTALKAVLAFSVVLYFRSMIKYSAGGAPAVVLILNALTTVFLFAFPLYMSILMLLQTTRISHFLSALQAMGLPVRIIVPVAVFFRFLPTVAEEWNGIRKAMAFRGISLSPAQVLLHPGRTIEYILVPMLFSSVSVMEEMAAAAMARGMDADIRRSSYEEVKVGRADYIVMFVYVCMILLALVTGYMAKRGVII